MPGASKLEGPNWGLTPRQLELTVKAMITMVENNAKPDYEKLAKAAGFNNATAALKNWNHVVHQLKALGENANGETDNGNGNGNDNKAGGKKRGKRQAGDAEAPPAKRGRKRKTAPPPAEEDEDEEQKLVFEGDAGEV